MTRLREFLILITIFSGLCSFGFPAIQGDANNDGKIDYLDANIIIGNILGKGAITGDGDANGNGVIEIGDVVSVFNIINQDVPPDPEDIAPEVDETGFSDIYYITEFLYNGDDPIQTDMTSDTIKRDTVAVIRGRIEKITNEPLGGVNVSVLNHPEFGKTKTRSDGKFDIVVNGGKLLTLKFSKNGYLPVQRRLFVRKRNFNWIRETICLVKIDGRVTKIDMNASVDMLIGKGSEMNDSDGKRQAMLMFPKGNKARMRLEDGSLKELSNISFRATEFTVGGNGKKAMPAELPENVGYTYCVEFTVDEAMSENAESVEFDKDLPFYVENFINFPVGTAVPIGYYDRKVGKWIPQKNGVVIKIMSIADGIAAIDTDGDGIADTSETLSLKGFTQAEMERLAGLYVEGTTLWRMAVKHFTPWDCNFPYGLPTDFVLPILPLPMFLNIFSSGDPDDPTPPPPFEPPCYRSGASMIEPMTQNLMEEADIKGTPFFIRYLSDRAKDRTTSNKFSLSLGDITFPASMEGINVEIEVAGQYFKQSFPAVSGQTIDFKWDGKDAYGRDLNGYQDAFIKVGYVYPATYYEPAELEASFASYGNIPLGIDRKNLQITTSQDMKTKVGKIPSYLSTGLGGWHLSIHHYYDFYNKMIYRGDGTQERSEPMGMTVSTFAGTGTAGFTGDGGLAVEAKIYSPGQMDTGANGSLYFCDSTNHRVRKVDPQGIITTVAGNGGQGFSGDGGLATEAELNGPVGVAISPEGEIYIGDTLNNRIRKIGLDGIITTICGNGHNYYSGDGGPAIDAEVAYPHGLDIDKDGNLYIADMNNDRIRRIDVNGIITTVAGNGDYECPTEGALATQTGIGNVRDLSVALDGSIYFVCDYRVIKINASDGRIIFFAGNGKSGYNGDGIPAIEASIPYPGAVDVDVDGNVYIADRQNHRIRKVTTDGIINTVVGNGQLSSSKPADGLLALQTYVNSVDWIKHTPSGIYYTYWTGNQIKFVNSISLYKFSTEDLVLTTSGDSSEIYVFDMDGKHRLTVDAFTQNPIYTFDYDDFGLLKSVADPYGNTTAIERDEKGNPKAIIAPGGQQTSLSVDSNGYLNEIKSSGETTIACEYTTGGLMTKFKDMNNVESRFQYGEDGELISDTKQNKKPFKIETQSTYNTRTSVLTTPGDKITTHIIELTSEHNWKVTDISPDKKTKNSENNRNGIQKGTTPSGVEYELQTQPDARFKTGLNVPKTLVMTTPSGRKKTYNYSRTCELAGPKDPLSMTKLTDTVDFNGKKSQYIYEQASKTITRQSASGKVTTTTLDDYGRIKSVKLHNAKKDFNYEYDEKGRLKKMIRGNRIKEKKYDDKNRLIAKAGTNGKEIHFKYNDADLVTSMTLPSNRTYNYEFDNKGNLTKIIMPNGQHHSITYNDDDRMATFTPPGDVGDYEYTYTEDSLTTQVVYPSGQTLNYEYDEAGRLIKITSNAGICEFNYADPALGCSECDVLSSYKRTPKSGASQTIEMQYDGDLISQINYVGDTNGYFQYGYENNTLYLNQIYFNDQSGKTSTLNITRDADGLLTKVGAFSYTRGGPGASLTQIEDNSNLLTFTFNDEDLPDGLKYRVFGQDKYILDLVYNSEHKIIEKNETIAGVSTKYEYVYNDDGALIEVKKDGILSETYTYDINGNRATRKLGENAIENCLYTSGDFIQQQGMVYVTIDKDGFMTSRGNDYFVHGPMSELLEARINNSNIVFYTYDAIGRLVHRRYLTSEYQYYYGNQQDIFQVTHFKDAAGNLYVLYYTEVGLLYAMSKGTSEYYYIGTDQAGTPRAVFDYSGKLIKKITYDSFGNLLEDTNPAFYIPVGFGGGIEDKDAKLIHLGMRYYDPFTGRWCSRDPLMFTGRQANLYVYVHNDPINFRDPSGLFCIGATYFEGIGGGGKVCNKDDKWAVCVEGGIGLGGGLNVDPTGMEEDDVKMQEELSASCGLVGVSAKCMLSKCPSKTGCNAKGKLGPLQMDSDGNISFSSAIPGASAPALKLEKCGASGKFSMEYCQQF